ncbi:MAG TPA: hypothetical protein VHL80_19805 [Polyangia bacterium]|nr:hypothetical protein [Polyangia bacterium]
MKLAAALPFALLIAAPPLSSVARAEDHHEEHQQMRREEHHAEARHEEQQRLPPRAPPPAWRGHPPGAHPVTPGWRQPVQPHAVRVLRPHAMRYGEHPWRHWGHPEFVRPVYYWDWGAVRSVTCVAEDSYGDQYPVTESTFAGFGLVNMTQVEDDALDRCYQESGGDQGCYLATCSHY